MAIVVDLTSTASGSTLADLRVQLRQRGFDHLDEDSEVDRLLNEAYHELCDQDEWPFLQADASGANGVATVTDLRMVLSVHDTAQRRWLQRVTREELVQDGRLVTEPGSPQVYYVDGASTVRAWPVGGTLAVRYLKTPATLTDDDDTPLVPDRFRDVIVTGAVRKVLLQESAAGDYQAVSAEWERRLATMRAVLIEQSADELQVRVPWSGDW